MAWKEIGSSSSTISTPLEDDVVDAADQVVDNLKFAISALEVLKFTKNLIVNFMETVVNYIFDVIWNKIEDYKKAGIHFLLVIPNGRTIGKFKTNSFLPDSNIYEQAKIVKKSFYDEGDPNRPHQPDYKTSEYKKLFQNIDKGYSFLKENDEEQPILTENSDALDNIPEWDDSEYVKKLKMDTSSVTFDGIYFFYYYEADGSLDNLRKVLLAFYTICSFFNIDAFKNGTLLDLLGLMWRRQKTTLFIPSSFTLNITSDSDLEEDPDAKMIWGNKRYLRDKNLVGSDEIIIKGMESGAESRIIIVSSKRQRQMTVPKKEEIPYVLTLDDAYIDWVRNTNFANNFILETYDKIYNNVTITDYFDTNSGEINLKTLNEYDCTIEAIDASSNFKDGEVIEIKKGSTTVYGYFGKVEDDDLKGEAPDWCSVTIGDVIPYWDTTLTRIQHIVNSMKNSFQTNDVALDNLIIFLKVFRRRMVYVRDGLDALITLINAGVTLSIKGYAQYVKDESDYNTFVNTLTDTSASSDASIISPPNTSADLSSNQIYDKNLKIINSYSSSVGTKIKDIIDSDKNAYEIIGEIQDEFDDVVSSSIDERKKKKILEAISVISAEATNNASIFFKKQYGISFVMVQKNLPDSNFNAIRFIAALLGLKDTSGVVENMELPKMPPATPNFATESIGKNDGIGANARKSSFNEASSKSENAMDESTYATKKADKTVTLSKFVENSPHQGITANTAAVTISGSSFTVKEHNHGAELSLGTFTLYPNQKYKMEVELTVTSVTEMTGSTITLGESPINIVMGIRHGTNPTISSPPLLKEMSVTNKIDYSLYNDSEHIYKFPNGISNGIFEGIITTSLVSTNSKPFISVIEIGNHLRFNREIESVVIQINKFRFYSIEKKLKPDDMT